MTWYVMILCHVRWTTWMPSSSLAGRARRSLASSRLGFGLYDTCPNSKQVSYRLSATIYLCISLCTYLCTYLPWYVSDHLNNKCQAAKKHGVQIKSLKCVIGWNTWSFVDPFPRIQIWSSTASSRLGFGFAQHIKVTHFQDRHLLCLTKRENVQEEATNCKWKLVFSTMVEQQDNTDSCGNLDQQWSRISSPSSLRGCRTTRRTGHSRGAPQLAACCSSRLCSTCVLFASVLWPQLVCSSSRLVSCWASLPNKHICLVFRVYVHTCGVGDREECPPDACANTCKHIYIYIYIERER